MRSLHARLLILWLMSLLVCVVVGVLLIEASPLVDPMPGLTASGFERPGAALGILAALVAGGAAWLSALMTGRSRRVRAIEAGLTEAGSAENIPIIPLTGSLELDRIVHALNDAGRRLTAQRQRSEELAARVASAERMACLRRVAAGLAREIRNPLTAMRVQAENALRSADPGRSQQALGDILDQIARLNELGSELLAMTEPPTPRLVRLELIDLLALLIWRRNEDAGRGDVVLEVTCRVASAWLDPEIVARIIDNLLSNALRQTPPGGRVRLTAGFAGSATCGLLRIEVSDSGPGVPGELHDILFEPFVTGRSDGIGLGLAVAQAFATAHGGTLHLLRPGGGAPGQGATFALDLPWQNGPTLTAEP